MLKLNKKIKDVDEKLFNIVKKINYIDFFNPINLKDEKEKFFNKIKNKEKYNPVFKYRTITKKQKECLEEQRKKIKIDFEQNDELKKIFNYHKKTLKNRIDLVYEIGNDEKIFNICKKNFGSFKKKDIEFVFKNIKKVDKFILESKDKISKGELIEQAESFLFNHNIKNWKIEFRKEGGAASVDSSKKIIFFKENSEYDANFINVIFYHEILGHIKQSENALKIGLKIFETGFGYYEKVHEGWALWNEKKVNEKVLERIIVYYMATFIASKKNFYDTYIEMLKYLDPENSFLITARVKRGISNTSREGSFLKDKSYLEGYLILDKMNCSDIKKIKMGIFDFSFFDVFSIFLKKYDL